MNHLHLQMRRRLLAFLVLLWAAIYLPGLGRLDLRGEEGRRVLPALNMMVSGNWIVPVIGGEPYLNKPPLINWIIAASYRLNGQVNEFTARLPSAVFVLLLVVQIMLQPGRWFSLKARFLSSLVFLTNIAMMEKGRLIEMEAMFVSLTGMAIVFWLFSFLGGKSPAWYWPVTGLVMGVTVFLKGPLALLVFYITVMAVLLSQGRLVLLLHWGHFLALAIMAAIPLGWYVAAQQQIPADAIADTLGGQMATRYAFKISPVEWLVQVLKAPVLLLPWLPAAALWFSRSFLDKLSLERRRVVVGLRWALVIGFILINLMPGTRARYSLPLFPLACLLIGYCLSCYRIPTALESRLRRGLLITAAVAVCAALAGTVGLRPDVAGVLSAFLLVVIAVGLLRRGRLFAGTMGLSVMMGIVLGGAGLAYGVYGTELTARLQTPDTTAEDIATGVPAGNTLYFYRPGFQSYTYYLPADREILTRPDQVTREVEYLLIRQEPWENEVLPLLPSHIVDNLGSYEGRKGGPFQLLRIRYTQADSTE